MFLSLLHCFQFCVFIQTSESKCPSDHRLVVAAIFGGLALLCFLAAMRNHGLTERVANFNENLFVLIVLEDRLDWSFWLGVGSVVTHFAICGAVAMSRIKLPKPEIKKPEEPTVSSLDLLY